MTPVGPILTASLFRPLHRRLLSLLRGLGPEDWNRPTVCPGWTVKDIAAHMLDTQLRRIALSVDGYAQPPDRSIESPADLAEWLNGLNAQWIRAARRLSPRQITQLLAESGPALAGVFESLDPAAPAPFGVSWAGEQESANWFDMGREYTEYWHHQQQIRDAVGAPALYQPRFLAPVLALFLRAVPYRYREVTAATGTQVQIRIEGRAGGVWTLLRARGGWTLMEGPAASAQAGIRLDEDAAWRLFCKGLTAAEARRRARLEGEETLAEPYFTALAIVA